MTVTTEGLEILQTYFDTLDPTIHYCHILTDTVLLTLLLTRKHGTDYPTHGASN